MLHRLIVLTSLFCCATIAGSFAFFARDQLAGASEQQQALVAAGGHASANARNPSQAPASPGPVAQPRRFIDGAAAKLTRPFGHLVSADSLWALRLIEVIGGLLVYGVGLGYLARFSSGLATSHRLA